MLQINLTKQAKKFFESLVAKNQRQLGIKLQELRLNPQPHDAKLLKGYSYCRADCGEYRIIYQFDSVVLDILLIEKRNDDLVYKKLKRSK